MIIPNQEFILEQNQPKNLSTDPPFLHETINFIASNGTLIYSFKLIKPQQNPSILLIFHHDKNWSYIELSDSGISQFQSKPLISPFQKLFCKLKAHQIERVMSCQISSFSAVNLEKSSNILADFTMFESHSQRKIGVLYQASGQTTEDEILQNTGKFENFEQFLTILGRKENLAPDSKIYAGGLDLKGRDGPLLYCCENGSETAFHVSTWLKHVNEDEQQVAKKRHIGNDNVLVLFQEEGAEFDLMEFRSQMALSWVVIQGFSEENGKVRCRVEVYNKIGVFVNGTEMPSQLVSGEEIGRDEFQAFVKDKIHQLCLNVWQGGQLQDKLIRHRNSLIQKLIE